MSVALLLDRAAGELGDGARLKVVALAAATLAELVPVVQATTRARRIPTPAGSTS